MGTTSSKKQPPPGRMGDLIESLDGLTLESESRTPAYSANGRSLRPYVPPVDAGANGIYSQATSRTRNDYPYPGHGTPFVGGFQFDRRSPNRMPPATPPRAQAARHHLADGSSYSPSPHPLAMPKPHHSPMSLTMQYASQPGLAPDQPVASSLQPPVLPSRPYSDPAGSSNADANTRNNRAGPHTPQNTKVSPPIHRRAVSAPISPVVTTSSASSKHLPIQCSGITAAGQRCKKVVKVEAARAAAEADVFCHVHEKTVRAVSGFYDRKTGQTWIKFEDWIPSYLQPSTQASLRSEMQKARSESDEEGYIYTFEILDESDKDVVHLKVGRATTLNRRIDQWSKQCRSKEQTLRGYWPDGLEPGQAAMRGLNQAGRPGAWCHRLERLVHLELADLVSYTPYKDSNFPNNSAPSADKVPKRTKSDVKRCPDCGKVHKEIFTFDLVEKGPYHGREWAGLVKPVIEKWGGFVEAYV